MPHGNAARERRVEFASVPEYERGYRRDDEILIQVTFEVPVQLGRADGLPACVSVTMRSSKRRPTTGGPAPRLVETLSGGAVNATFADGELAPEQQLYAGPNATGVTVTSSPEDESGYRAGETFTFDITFGVAMAPETPMDIYLQVGANVRSATLIEGHSSAAARTFSYEYTFTDSDSDLDGIEILHTPNWDEDGELFNGYMFISGIGRNEQPYDSVPMREFVNPSPGVLSDHKVVGSEPQEESSEHLSWLPTEE